MRPWPLFLRRAGVCFVPLDPVELAACFHPREPTRGRADETAELRALRENVRLIQARGVRPSAGSDWIKGLTDAILSGTVSMDRGDPEVMRARVLAGCFL